VAGYIFIHPVRTNNKNTRALLKIYKNGYQSFISHLKTYCQVKKCISSAQKNKNQLILRDSFNTCWP